MCFFIFLAVRDWQRASFYALSPDECHKLAGPISHLGPRLEKLFRTPKWVHTIVTTSDDTVTLLFVFASYFERTGILDKIMPAFSTAKKETEEKYAKGSSKNNVQPITNTGQVQPPAEYSNGYSRQSIDPRQQSAIGSQWAAE